MTNILGIKKTRTTPYHPRSDWMNRTLKNILSKLVNVRQDDWDIRGFLKHCYIVSVNVVMTSPCMPPPPPPPGEDTCKNKEGGHIGLRIEYIDCKLKEILHWRRGWPLRL